MHHSPKSHVFMRPVNTGTHSQTVAKETKLHIPLGVATTTAIGNYVLTSFRSLSDSVRVLKEDVHPVIESRQIPLKGRPPPQIIDANRKITSRRDAISNVENLVARPAALGHVAGDGNIQRKARMQRVITRQAQT